MCSPCGPCSPCDPCCAPFEPRCCKSHELRCGIMYTTCDCIKRNGLQDKCPRSLCQGRPACMCFPVPSCCPASFPLRFANMLMGVNNKRMRCAATGACCSGGGCCGGCPPPRACGGCCGSPCGAPCCGPCNGCCTTPCCGPHSPPCGAPCPVPCSPAPGFCCPPLPEGGIPDPRVWNCCNTPPTYPCPLCPARYLHLKHRANKDNVPCVWCGPCKAHCYNTPPKPCC